MAKKKDIIDLFEGVFGKPPGSKLTKPLRDGACLQATVDGVDVVGEKRNGCFVISKSTSANPDISVEMNRAACEYIAASKELADFVTRTRECINREVDDCYMDYQINAGVSRLLLKGYLDFVRMLGLI